MLVRVLNTQIRTIWELVEPMLAESLPPHAAPTEETMGNIFKAFVSNKAILWAMFNKDEIEEVPDFRMTHGIVATQFVTDQMSQTVNLLIYAMYGDGYLTKHIWTDGLQTLKKFAREYDCHKIIAYTVSEDIRDLWTEILGGESDTMLLEMEV